MIVELAEAIEELLNSERQPGGLIEGVKAVKIGDDLPLSDLELPGIAFDVTTLPKAPDSEGSAPGSRFDWVIPFQLILYDTSSIPGAATKNIWKLLTPPTPETPGGLIWLLNKYNRITLDSGPVFFTNASRFTVGSITKNKQRLTGAVTTLTCTTWGPKPS